uniref:PAP2_C domain-containing protein n=1 Tax=Parastrongyloides trichosuri TaxID=131310 RepID=A0A0N4ZLR2_PARTI
MVNVDFKDIEKISQIGNIDKKRTFIALLILIFGWILNNIVLAWVHDRVPVDRTPLPDIFFSLFPEIPEAIEITEFILLLFVLNTLVVIVIHQDRWIIARRLFFCFGLSYIIRAICIAMIQVPVPSTKTYCAPQMESSFSVLLKRVLSTFWSAGIEAVRPRVLCGDLIVSGHTLCLITSLQAIKLYSPRKVNLFIIFYKIACVVAIISILVARKHYTIDVFLGYMVATNVFRTYHSLAHSYHRNELHENLHSESTITPLVVYFERDFSYSHSFVNYLDILTYLKNNPLENKDKKLMNV